MILYYAHSLHLYDTPQEVRDVALLQSLGFEVNNPNQPFHQEGYSEKGMDYFIEDILPGCDVCAFRAYSDMSIGAGVMKEVQAFIDMAKPVFEIPTFFDRKYHTVEQTRLFLLENGQR
jgi:hypothetical protein